MQQTLLRYPEFGDRIQMARSKGRLARRNFIASKNGSYRGSTPSRALAGTAL